MNHGGYHYVNDGCKCSECRDAHAAYTKAARARRWASRTPVGGVLVALGAAKHGRPATYTNWGCECPLCRAAWNAYCAQSYHNRKARRGQSE